MERRAGGSEGARGSAVERNLDAGPAGSGRAVARATSRGVGEAVIVEGISPGRTAAETSPDRTHRRNFPPRRGPPPKTFSDLGPPPKFFQREGMTPKYFPNQCVASAKFFPAQRNNNNLFFIRNCFGQCREGSAFFDTASSRERERACILKLKFWGGKEIAILGGTIACIRGERDREHAFQS